MTEAGAYLRVVEDEAGRSVNRGGPREDFAINILPRVKLQRLEFWLSVGPRGVSMRYGR